MKTRTCRQTWPAQAPKAEGRTSCSIELLVLQDGLSAGKATHPQGSWVRKAIFDADALQAVKGSVLLIKCRPQPAAA